MKKIILLALITVFFINNVYAGTISLDFTEKKPVNASLRSALMPGWGQMWNEQPTKAWITFGVFAVSVASAFYFNSEADKKYDKYEEQGLINGDYYSDYEDNRTISQVFTFVAIGTWVYGIIDAYFTTKKQNAAPKPSSINLSYNHKDNGLYLSYSKRFSFVNN